jgi:medium-chain acyl-[acyl-carrier-protein] hydrolase
MNHKRTSGSWLAFEPLRRDAQLRLFCFPYAGGSSLIFRNWERSFPTAIDVCPVQLPGRGSRMLEPAFTKLGDLVTELTKGLLAYLDRPFAFFGHSMGALIGFELARRLRAQHGLMPSHLFASGRYAPQIEASHRITYNLPEDELLAELRRLNGSPDEVLEHPELMQLLLPIIRADFQLVQTYDYQPELPLSCGITALGGLKDPDVSREHLDAWREQTTGTFAIRMFLGDHFFLQTAQSTLLRMIHQDLKKSLGAGG